MKKWKAKALSLVLAAAMLVTTIGGDYITAYAGVEDDTVAVEETVETPVEEVVEAVEEVVETPAEEVEESEEPVVEETAETVEEVSGSEGNEEIDPDTIKTAGIDEVIDEIIAGEGTEEDLEELDTDLEEVDEEEIELGENEIKISYCVNDEEAGYIEGEDEIINTEDEEAVILGATAVANEGYEFINWTDEEGNEVSDEETYVPEEKVTATYTANFEEVEAEEEEENLPAQEFEQVIDGVKITASAPEGAFPEGTVMNAEKVVITETIEAAIDDATDDDVEVKEIIAYDITFTKDDEEVQPKVAISVNFSNVELEGENLQVFHMEDEEAEAEPVSEVVENTEEIEVEAESFSLYVLVGSEYVQLKTGEKVELSVGETKKILTNDKSNLDLSIGYSIESVTWSVKNSEIASVGKASTYTSGGTTYYTSEITGNKVGTTTVTVTFEYYKGLHSSKTTKKSFTYDVNVKAASASGNSEVACFATAGGQEMNADMAALLGLDPKAHNSAGYYPVGVITLPNTMLSKSTSNDKGCIVTDDDFNALLGAIGVIDPSKISTNAKWAGNRNNTVGDHIASVQKDLGGKGQGSNCTALFYWNKAEHDSSNPEYVVSGKNYYKYHLDMRFTTVTVTYKKMSDGKEIGKQVYLKSTPSIDPKDTIGSYLSSLGDDYEILGYYTKQQVKPEYKYTFNQSLEDNLTLYLDLNKVSKVTVKYDVNGGTSTTTTPQPDNGVYTFNNLKVNSDMKYVNQPTRDNYTFIGWKEESTGNVIAQDALPKRVTRNETYTAQWLKSTVDEEIVVTIKGHSDSAEYDGKLHEVSGYDVVSITMDGKAYTEYTEDDFELAVGAKAYASGTTIGTYNMFLTNKSFKNNNEKFTNVKFVVEDGVLTITKIQTPVTIIVDGNTDTREYTGSLQTHYGYMIQSYDMANITVTGPAQDAKKAKGTDAGTYYMGLSENDFDVSSSVYETVNLKVNDGWLKITPKDSYEITVTGKNDTREYNGQKQSVALGYDFSDFDSSVITIAKEPGDAAKAEGTTVGEYKQNLTQDMFAATSKNYTKITFKVVPGKLTIVASTKPYVITVNGKSDTKVYNGQKQSVPGYSYAEYDQTITVSGPEQESVKAEGTNVGEYKTIFDESKFSASSKNYKTITFKFVPGTLKITKADKYEVLIVGNTKTTTYNRSEQNVTGYTITNPDTSVKVDGPTQAEAIAKGTNVGTYPMNLEGKFTASSENYKEVTVKVTDGWLKINKDEKPYVITVNGKSDTKEYSGQTQSVTGYTYADYDSSIKVTGPAQEAVIASGKDAGTYKQNLLVNDFSATSDNYGNISFKVNPGTLTITKSKTPYTITVNGKSDTKEYNGQTQSVTGYEYAEYDETITVSGPAQEAVKAEGINAGEYTQNLSAGQFSATSDNYETINFTVNPGKLTIVASKTPYTITVNGKSDTKEYNGTTQSVTGYDYAEYDNTITISGPEQSAVIAEGINAGEYPQNLSASQFSASSNNYETINFTVNPGTLTIVASKTPYEIVVNGKSDEKEYTGQTQSVTGYDYEDYDETIEVSGPEQAAVIASGKDAGEYPQNLSADQFSAISDNYETINFTVNPGTLKIIASKTPYEIEVTGNSYNLIYNKEEQKFFGFTIGDYDETIEITQPAQEDVFVTGTDAGDYELPVDVSLFDASSDNYETITFVPVSGMCKITPIEDEYIVTIKGNKDTKTYSGYEQKVTGYEVTNPDATVTVTGPDQEAAIASGTNVGTYPMGLDEKYFSAESKNYTNIKVVVEDGSLEIIKAVVTVDIEGNTDTVVYDGNSHSVNGWKASLHESSYSNAPDNAKYDISKVTYDGSATVRGTEVGTYNMNLDAGLFRGNDDNYEVSFDVVKDGKLVINPQPYYPPDEPDPTPDPDPLPPAIIPENPVPLAPAPDADLAPGVLGARRTLGNGSVLGARRGMDQAVLGKRRNPNTGDNSLFMWLVALMSSLAGAGATLFGINKTKKKDED